MSAESEEISFEKVLEAARAEGASYLPPIIFKESSHFPRRGYLRSAREIFLAIALVQNNDRNSPSEIDLMSIQPYVRIADEVILKCLEWLADNGYLIRVRDNCYTLAERFRYREDNQSNLGN